MKRRTSRKFTAIMVATVRDLETVLFRRALNGMDAATQLAVVTTLLTKMLYENQISGDAADRILSFVRNSAMTGAPSKRSAAKARRKK